MAQKNEVIEGLDSNHVEADTQIIMEAVKSDISVVVKASDTDILILMFLMFLLGLSMYIV